MSCRIGQLVARAKREKMKAPTPNKRNEITSEEEGDWNRGNGGNDVVSTQQILGSETWQEHSERERPHRFIYGFVFFFFLDFLLFIFREFS